MIAAIHPVITGEFLTDPYAYTCMDVPLGFEKGVQTHQGMCAYVFFIIFVL